MKGLIAVAVFLVLFYVFAKWFRLLVIRYRMMENAIRITVFGLPLFRIPYDRIQGCEIIKASKLWKPWNTLLIRGVWLHTRLFVDGAIVKTRWVRYVLTPDNPEEFARFISERKDALRT